jgi:hypothetical protein
MCAFATLVAIAYFDVGLELFCKVNEEYSRTSMKPRFIDDNRIKKVSIIRDFFIDFYL